MRGLVIDQGPIKADGTNSCNGLCGGGPTSSGCWCDALCPLYGDCCPDYQSRCQNKTPKKCGPFTGGACVAGEICDIKSCGVGATGTCAKQPQPQECIELMYLPAAPVCGCDGKTYGSNCDRLAAGAALAHAGACQVPPPPPPPPPGKTCGGIAGIACPAGQVCDIRFCAADASGTCVPKPDPLCIQLMYLPYSPVCGCDGKTYGSDCDRLNAGVALDHEGACQTQPPPPPPPGKLCGGIAGIPCPAGQKCLLDGNYPDASGHCVDLYFCKTAVDCADLPSYMLCIGDWQCNNQKCEFHCK